MIVRLKNINTSKMKPIGREKYHDKVMYYLFHKNPSERIVIDSRGYLIDGYSTYLIYETLGKKIVKVDVKK